MNFNRKKTYFSIMLFLVFTLIFSAMYFGQNIQTSQEYLNDSEDKPLSTASWDLNGVVISDADLSQIQADICSDGAGGIIIAWMDYRSGMQKIYAQRINATGHVKWIVDGIAVASTSYDQANPKICSDGQGGAIIVWVDYRSPGIAPSIYAQRLNANGVKQWGSSGVDVLHDSEYYQLTPRIISDGANGSIIIWRHDDGTGNMGIIGQRLNATGHKQWGYLKQIYTGGGTEYAEMCSDGSGGAYITWSSGDVYAQRINSAGNRYWAAGGVVICNALATQQRPQIINDGTNNAVIVWEDCRATGVYMDIYAQRIDGTGTVKWAVNGIGICTAAYDQQFTKLCTDGLNGSIITWQDNRRSNLDIYIQRINTTGQVYWTSNGIPVANTDASQAYPTICSDGVGGAIIAWQQNDIYAQRINTTGHAQWQANGSAICGATGVQQNPIAYSDGAEGAFIVWEDYRSEIYDVIHGDLYAYRTIIPSTPLLQPITPSLDTDGIIHLNWTDCFGAGYYYIYRETSSISAVQGLTPIAKVTTSNYTDTIPANGDYYYVMVAGNPIGNSTISNCETVTASVPPGTPTLNPIIPPVDPDGHIILSWSKKVAITTYYVYRNTSVISDVGGLTPIAAVSENNCTDDIAINGKYYYVIVSENNLGNSSISNCRNVTVGIPPGTPSLDPILPLVDPDGTVTLNWDDIATATLYYIYRDASAIATVNGLTPIDTAAVSNYTDVLTNGRYFYVIVATDGWANSSISNCENVTVGIPLSAPNLDPILPQVDPDGTVTLNWDDIATATLYYIYRSTSSIATVNGLTPIDIVSVSNYTEEITNIGRYFYVIVATDSWANSSISNCENVTIAIAPTLTPIPPEISETGIILLNWTELNGAVRYYIFRETFNISSVESLTPIANSSSTTYVDFVDTDGTYYYVIVASDGQVNSTLSNCVSVTIAIPGNPVGSFLLIQIIPVIGIVLAVTLHYRRRKIKLNI